jgi:hypothetical protein
MNSKIKKLKKVSFERFILDQKSELNDKVMPLQEISVKPKSLAKSKASSKYISQLESQIENEREERIKMQNEIEEIRQMNMELMSRISEKQG